MAHRSAALASEPVTLAIAPLDWSGSPLDRDRATLAVQSGLTDAGIAISPVIADHVDSNAATAPEHQLRGKFVQATCADIAAACTIGVHWTLYAGTGVAYDGESTGRVAGGTYASPADAAVAAVKAAAGQLSRVADVQSALSAPPTAPATPPIAATPPKPAVPAPVAPTPSKPAPAEPVSELRRPPPVIRWTIGVGSSYPLDVTDANQTLAINIGPMAMHTTGRYGRAGPLAAIPARSADFMFGGAVAAWSTRRSMTSAVVMDPNAGEAGLIGERTPLTRSTIGPVLNRLVIEAGVRTASVVYTPPNGNPGAYLVPNALIGARFTSSWNYRSHGVWLRAYSQVWVNLAIAGESEVIGFVQVNGAEQTRAPGPVGGHIGAEIPIYANGYFSLRTELGWEPSFGDLRAELAVVIPILWIKHPYRTD